MNLKLNLKNILCFCCLFLSFTLQAQPSLQLDWMKLDQKGIARKIKRDSHGNSIVLARGGNNTFNRIITLKYDKTGTLLWKRIYVDPLNSFPDVAEDVDVDSLDNIYVTGTVNFDGNQVSLNSRSILIKYDSLGTLIWKTEYGVNINPLLQGTSWSVKVFNNKHIYIAGHVDSTSGGGFWKRFLAQYDSSGLLNWTYIDTNSYETYATQVMVDKAGNAYLCGSTVCCLPGYNMYTTKFDSSGNLIWHTIVDEPFHQYSVTITALIDDSANIYLGGDTYGTLTGTGYDSYIAKIDSSGLLKWTGTFFADSTSNESDGAINIVLDRNNNCYLLSYAGIGSGNLRGSAIKFENQTGKIDWSITKRNWNFANGIASFDGSIALAESDSLGNFVVSVYDSISAIKRQYKLLSQARAFDLYEMDSCYVLAGTNIEPFTSNGDTIMICKIALRNPNNILPSNVSGSEISISPNPFENEFKLVSEQPGANAISVKVYSSQGKLVLTDNFKNVIRIKTANWRPGVYFLEVRSESASSVKKIIKY